MRKEFDFVITNDEYVKPTCFFDDLGLNPIHPQDYCLKIFSTTSGEVYWQFCRKGVPIQPNLIEERIFKTFVSVAYKIINYENY